MNIRPATREDAPQVAELFGSVEEALLGRPSNLDAQAIHGWWQTIAFETNTWLCEEDGVLVAGAIAEVEGDCGNSVGAVRPSAQGRGLGTQLLELVEGRLAEEKAARVHAWELATGRCVPSADSPKNFGVSLSPWQLMKYERFASS